MPDDNYFSGTDGLCSGSPARKREVHFSIHKSGGGRQILKTAGIQPVETRSRVVNVLAPPILEAYACLVRMGIGQGTK